MEIITTDKAPAAIGPYSQAIRTGNLLFCSGQLGIDPATGKLAGDDVRSQTVQVLKNIRGLLGSVGLDLRNVVKTTLFLASMDDFKTVNELYGAEFSDHKPARSTIEVSRLPLGAKIEIECVAAAN